MIVELRLLGGFDVSIDGRAVTNELVARRDPARLVKVLALARDIGYIASK